MGEMGPSSREFFNFVSTGVILARFNTTAVLVFRWTD
jgi:hypothetical protein